MTGQESRGRGVVRRARINPAVTGAFAPADAGASPYRWRALALSYVSVVSFALVFQAVPTVLRQIVDSFQVSHAQAGLLMSLFALPGIVLSIPGGVILDRYGTKLVGGVTFGVMLIGAVVVASSTSFPVMLAARLLSGCGAMVLIITASQNVARWFSGRELGLAMGMFNTAMPFGTIVSFNTFSRMGPLYGWRIPLVIAASFALVSFAAFLWFTNPPRNEGRCGLEAGRMRGFSGIGIAAAFVGLRRVPMSVWFLGLVWLWFNAATLSFTTFAMDYFRLKALPVGLSGVLASSTMLGSLVLSPLIGLHAQRKGWNVGYILAGNLLLALAFSIMPFSRGQLFPVALLVVASPFIPAPLFSLLPRILDPGSLGVGYGILSALLNVGTLIGPYVVGLAYDLTSSYAASLLVMAFFSVMAAMSVLPVRAHLMEDYEPDKSGTGARN